MVIGARVAGRSCSLAVALVLLLASRVDAQVLGDVIVDRLDANCRGLSGAAGPYGPHLAQVCAGGGGVSSGSGGALSVDTRGGEDETQRLLKRLKERRDGTAASADGAPGLGGFSLFASGDYQAFEKGVTKFEPGYTRDTWGGTFGGDYSFGGRAVVGLALSYAHANGTYLRHGGTFETDAYGPTLYGSIFPMPNAFVDVLVGYTRHEYVMDRRYNFTMTPAVFIPMAVAHGVTRGDEFKAGVSVGRDYPLGALTLGPRLGLNFRENHIDPYAETGGSDGKGPRTGLELAYDRQHQTSVTSSAGGFGSMAIGTGFGVLVPQTSVAWIHEFQDDQRVTYFHFVEDGLRRRFRFQNDTPVRDYFNASLGLVMVLPNGLSPFVNVRQLFGQRAQSSHTVTAGLRFSF